MSFQKLPHSLKMDNLFLDVRLEAIPLLGTDVVDLTGRKTFTVGMMRNNKGFGITDINIETKASLQPIVDITFKDTYGNTAFDTLSNSGSDGKLNYSLLFDWPPPKFRFTFKGYLGKPVTWIMNLKKTNTRYVSSDGSYEIKASFVPNQWGFLADIPFLYLLAKKRLKRDLDGSVNKNLSTNNQKNKIESIFDIIKIGKTVETKTKQISKEFDKLQKQLSVLKANSIDGLINKDFEPNDTIDGKVSGRQPIKGIKNVAGQNDLSDFQTIKIQLPPSLDASDSIKFQETLKSLKASASFTFVEHRKILALIGNPDSIAKNMNILGVESPTIPQEDINKGAKIIDDNLKLIDIETKRRLFETSSTELGAVTISEVFSRLSADGAFILGSILDAGYVGYNNNLALRTQNKIGNKNLIGRFFPLTTNDSTGEQEPAFSAGITDAGCEMDFVRKFIVAISEGIADNQTENSENTLNNQDSKLISRINNLEIISPNPYKDANSQQILETLLIRSGIAAYITRSFDPNKPGDYDNTTGFDNDSAEEIKQLADKELKNIPDSILSTLSSDDYSDLKNFCKFINNFLDSDGEGILKDGEIQPIPSNIQELKQLVVRIKKSNPNGDTFENLVDGDSTVDSFLKRFVGPTSIFFEGQPKGITDSISYENFLAGYLYNNNTLWTLPNADNSIDYYTYTVFNNSTDQSAIDGVMNNDSDSEFTSQDDKESKHPLGIVKLINGNSDENKNPDENVRLKTINDRILKGQVLDFSRLKDINSIPLIFKNNVYYPDVSQINNQKGILITKPYNESNIGNGVTYLVYSNVSSDVMPHLTWGLFKTDVLADRRGTNQRIFLRRICTDLENRMNKIEDEKNNILSQVLGKAQSSENSLYIQMHHIFHQWGVLGFGMDSASNSTNKSSNGADRISEQSIAEPGKIALKLEENYGRILEYDAAGNVVSESNVNGNISTPIIPGGNASSMGFRYDFPMERINPPPDNQRTNVAHSIINIDSLYKPNANTTLLNIIQQLCTKNNFMFVPIPGNSDYTNIQDIFAPSLFTQPKVGNVFHILFTPTPESRSKQNDGTPLNLETNQKNNFDAFEIEFGSPDNAIIKNLDVSTEESKPTAESILNLQRLVDKDNSNKVVTTDCSILSVMEGRSYKMKVEMLGNAQISPMQYFYVSKMPIFSGLYQVMNVTHSIRANDMSTSLEGIKMRFDGSQMKGICPITLESLKALGNTSNTIQPGVNTSSPNTSAPEPIVAQPMEQQVGANVNNGASPVSNGNQQSSKGIFLPGGKGPKQNDPVLDSLVNGYVNEKRYRKILSALPSSTAKESLLEIQVPVFGLPIAYNKVSSKFGLRNYNAKTGKNDPDNPDFHPGIDLVGSSNAEIRSIADGSIYLARTLTSKDEVITLESIAISENETRITGGQIVGKAIDGSTYTANASSTGFIKYIRKTSTNYEISLTWVTPNTVRGKGYGQVVIVKHNQRFFSLYAHLSEVKVTNGQSVKKGDVLGLQGNTMDGAIRSTGAHLHFEIWDKSVSTADFYCAVNPEQYIKV